MARPAPAIRSRSKLDRRFKDVGPPSRFVKPVRGWIRAIREGLGMSAQQLGQRLGIKQPSVVAIEQSELKGTIELATLQRVAEAMNCTLIYALIPNKPLETMVRERARLLVRTRKSAVEHSMLLEDQAVEEVDFEAQVDEYLRQTNPGRLWDEL